MWKLSFSWPYLVISLLFGQFWLLQLCAATWLAKKPENWHHFQCDQMIGVKNRPKIAKSRQKSRPELLKVGLFEAKIGPLFWRFIAFLLTNIFEKWNYLGKKKIRNFFKMYNLIKTFKVKLHFSIILSVPKLPKLPLEKKTFGQKSKVGPKKGRHRPRSKVGRGSQKSAKSDMSAHLVTLLCFRLSSRAATILES